MLSAESALDVTCAVATAFDKSAVQAIRLVTRVGATILNVLFAMSVVISQSRAGLRNL